MPGPVHNLSVRLRALFCAERRPSDQAFEHDGSDTPPIAAEVVALSSEDLRGNVVWCAHCRESQLTSRLAPGIDLVAVADGQLNLIERHAVTIVSV